MTTMTTLATDVHETKPKRRSPVRSSARPVAPKVKTTLCLDDDASTRLSVFAAMSRRERSEIVSQLIRDHLKRYRVQDLDRNNPDLGDTGEDRQDSSAA